MARIRTIKPEFCQSETVGKLSRDARLLFIQLWTIVDDDGRARAPSRMLASLLYPYDDDAPDLIGVWLDELEAMGCIRRYEVDGSHFLDIPNWLKHQKIDRPSPSKLPAFDEGSRGLDEDSMLTLDQDQEVEKDQDTSSLRSDVCHPPPKVDDLTLAISAYRETATRCDWPIPAKWTNARRTALRKRLEDAGGLSGWCEALAKAERSSFMRGTGHRSKGYENWHPDIAFFLSEEKFAKLMEGSYDDDKFAGDARRVSPIVQSVAAVLARRELDRERQGDAPDPYARRPQDNVAGGWTAIEPAINLRPIEHS